MRDYGWPVTVYVNRASTSKQTNGLPVGATRNNRKRIAVRKEESSNGDPPIYVRGHLIIFSQLLHDETGVEGCALGAEVDTVVPEEV
jgi:hypothetical protein